MSFRECRSAAGVVCLVLCHILVLSAGAASTAGPELTDSAALRQQAVGKAVDSLVRAMPSEAGFSSVGVVPLAGDSDNLVTNQLAVALTKAGRFQVKQLSRPPGSPTPSQLQAAAQRTGCDALVTGGVTRDDVTTGSAHVEISLSLVRGRDGHAVWTASGKGDERSAVSGAQFIETIIERTRDTEGLRAAAQERIAQQACAELAAALPSRVGVVPLVGDSDGSLTRRLVSALSRNREVVLLNSAGPTLDSTTGAELGRKARLNAVVMGQVERSEIRLGRADVTLHARLVRTRDGAILKAITIRRVYQSHVGRYRWLFAAVAALVVLLLAVLLLPRLLRGVRRAVPGQAMAMRARELESDQRNRQRVSREIAACLDLLTDLSDRAAAAGQKRVHSALLDLRRDLDLLRLEIENAPFGHQPELAKARVRDADLRRLAEIEGRALGMLEGLHRDLQGMHEGQVDSEVEEALAGMRGQVHDIRRRLGERQSVLEGIGG